MLHTIGYEGSSLPDFIETLQHVEIDILIDVRDRAQSRKKGFSKTALSEELASAGIDYLHLKELGDPKEGRVAARQGKHKLFEQIYLDVLATKVAQNAVHLIEEKTQSFKVCLLCYERDPLTCHRKYISDLIDSRQNKKTRHLGVKIFERAA